VKIKKREVYDKARRVRARQQRVRAQCENKEKREATIDTKRRVRERAM
jgi:hypothetical protein